MRLAEVLRLSAAPRLAFVGAGGKTTAMFALARELRESYNTVLITTTTHLGKWQAALGDAHLLVSRQVDLPVSSQFPGGIVVVTGSQSDDERWDGLQGDILQGLFEVAEASQMPLLIEADGARMLPLKAPAVHEPAIPGFVDTVVNVVGLSGLGKPLTDTWVHRRERFAQISGIAHGEEITPEAVVNVACHPEGGLKNIPMPAHRIFLLNQADTDELQASAGYIADRLLACYQSVVVTALGRDPAAIFSAHERVAGIILAAGGSQRLGQQKQMLEWRGKPLVWHTVKTALASGLNPVVVVLGAGSEVVGDALAGLPVSFVINQRWAEGQSTSLFTGLAALPPETGAAVFLLADQPQIPATLVHMLVETHQKSLASIVAPLIDGQRGNPVLFDRRTFSDLSSLQGDQGGRAIFHIYPPEYVPWLDGRLLLDIDTPQDYQRLLSEFP